MSHVDVPSNSRAGMGTIKKANLNSKMHWPWQCHFQMREHPQEWFLNWLSTLLGVWASFVVEFLSILKGLHKWVALMANQSLNPTTIPFKFTPSSHLPQQEQPRNGPIQTRDHLRQIREKQKKLPPPFLSVKSIHSSPSISFSLSLPLFQKEEQELGTITRFSNLFFLSLTH